MSTFDPTFHLVDDLGFVSLFAINCDHFHIRHNIWVGHCPLTAVGTPFNALTMPEPRFSKKSNIYHYHHRGAGGIRAPPGQVSLQYNANYSMFLAASSLSNSAFPGKIREEESQLLRAQFTKDNPFLEQHYEDPA
mmetsp:Transcript_11535/g.14384  ORF Transcript_11535/g.14384 Transcript_11535/m.14384 type:complete len:135 (-) Transcript_11535:100-504(-)